MTKKQEGLSEAQLTVLNQNYDVVEEGGSRISLPRMGMLSKDITEEKGTGKNKQIKVIEAAGTFYTERDLGETDEKGKKLWTKEFIEGEEIEVVIVYHRRQLRKYDEGLKAFYSSSIFDNGEQIIPLYLNGKVVKRGTQEQLQSMFPAVSAKGKPTSDLKEDCLLYVVYEGELFQMNLSQSSKWEFKTYARKVGNPSTVVTRIGSVEDTSGSNTYKKCVFVTARQITAKEFDTVVESQSTIKAEVESSAKYFLETGDKQIEEDNAEKEYNALTSGKKSKEF